MYLDRTPMTKEEADDLLSELPPITPRIVKKEPQDALGFVLAEDIFAPFPVPAFRRSGYDGYGILADDDGEFPKVFEIMENIGAGSSFDEALESGQCVRIMTGAKVPDSVAKVIMLEDTEKIDESHVKILATSSKSNIAEIGEEVVRGKKILSAGSRVNAGALSVICAFGLTEIAVYDKPRVGILATGSELLTSDDIENGKIFNSNGPMLAALVKENSGIVAVEASIPDDLYATRAKIDALTKNCDLVITTGGVSVGDFDFMAVVAKESGHLLFNKLAMRPGSPTTAFVQNDTPVIALSGNPSACFAGFHFFAEPLIKRFQTEETALVPYQAILLKSYTKKNAFDRYLNGYMNEESEVLLEGHGQSSELTSLSQANCFFKVPHDTTLSAGDLVDVWLLP